MRYRYLTPQADLTGGPLGATGRKVIGWVVLAVVILVVVASAAHWASPRLCTKCTNPKIDFAVSIWQDKLASILRLN
jgi:hypothetical protein